MRDDDIKDLERWLDREPFLEHDINVFVTKTLRFAGKEYPSNGNAMLVAGGFGDGKTRRIIDMFGLDNTRMDNTVLKEFVWSIPKFQAKIFEKFGVDIAGWNFETNDQAAVMHGFLRALKLNDLYTHCVAYAYRSFAEDQKPDLIFDKALTSGADFINLANSCRSDGYKTENIHLVWLLEHRETAHTERRLAINLEETARTMAHLTSYLREYMDGDFWIAFARPDGSDGISETYQVKKAGEPLIPYCRWDDRIREKIREYVPDF